MSDHELRVSKIRDGTVIDHVEGGQALNVLARSWASTAPRGTASRSG